MPEGYTGFEVYRRMHALPQNAALLDEAREATDKLKAAHTEVADRLAKIQGKMDARWSGDASAKAQAGLNPIIQTSHQASEDLNRTSGSLNAQNGAFHGAKSKLAQMDSTRPSTDDLASYNPFGASDSEKAAAEWDTKDKNNKETYGRFYADTEDNRGSVVKEYPALNAAPAGIAVGQAPASPPVTGFGETGGPGTAGRKGSSGRYSGGYSGPTGGPSSPVTPSAPQGSGGPGGRPDVPDMRGPSDSTTVSGYAPPKPPVSEAPGFGSGLLPTFGPSGPGSDSSYSGGGSGLGVPGGGGTGSGAGRISGGIPGTGAGAGAGPGHGRGSGAGLVGEPGAARPGGASGAAGARGAATPGMGGMGAGAGKGKGAEDEEHKRKVTLPEQDADALFGGVPDGVKPVPPTIGT